MDSPALFTLDAPFEPRGDQPRAIETIAERFASGTREQVLLGVTGSGKTFTMAHTIVRTGLPTLVLAPNKTLAAQLFGEFQALFPNNAVEYFVSYYDYYQPEAYIPSSDTLIEKDASRNEQIERMRNSATRSLMERRDVVIVASISCIYGLGSPSNYRELAMEFRVGERHERQALLRRLVQLQYARSQYDFRRGTFRARGDVIEIFPAYEEDVVIRLELFGDDLEAISEVNPVTGEVVGLLERVTIFPSTQYITPKDRLQLAIQQIEQELAERYDDLQAKGRFLEAQRLQQRTRFDLEMLRETGICPGIENYSRHLDGRRAGDPPATLVHYFPEDWLLIVDESHVTMPQAGGMFRGDRSRKEVLVEYGFRLPSALDNRPLKLTEFEELFDRVLYVSATPAAYELERAKGARVEQIVRPTGLLDPEITVKPARNQVDDLVGEMRKVIADGDRVLVTTLTKRFSEELTEYLGELGLKVKYLHSDVDTLERTAILRDLRLGVFDVLVGINLLREGLDLPEVALVAVLDADKEGYLRSTTSLVQTCGRAARNLRGRVILYGDSVTASMNSAIEETKRRRAIQEQYNRDHGITPTSIRKDVRDLLTIEDLDYAGVPEVGGGKRGKRTDTGAKPVALRGEALKVEIARLRAKMAESSAKLDFEEAARLRDEIFRLEAKQLRE
ncbi:MAG: excinuclease ABC subunit UvrB [Planctomycetes bacterium]|nr:excinuclease ABC subunit UvrB [Planctomycetota bacterium]